MIAAPVTETEMWTGPRDSADGLTILVQSAYKNACKSATKCVKYQARIILHEAEYTRNYFTLLVVHRQICLNSWLL